MFLLDLLEQMGGRFGVFSVNGELAQEFFSLGSLENR